jgi:putative colanic acid biosynthesis acetyltransferase WcaF
MEQRTLNHSKIAMVNLSRCARFNYSAKEYLGRLTWVFCWLTIWKISWKRLYTLRPILLMLFRARLSIKNEMSASTWIEMPWNLEMGEYCSVGPRVIIYNLGHVTIGSHTVISQDAYLCGGSHDYTTETMPLMKSDIVVGNHVWICAGAFIGPGVKIGAGAVVGARAVVVKDVAPWTVVAGNPARAIKQRELKYK